MDWAVFQRTSNSINWNAWIPKLWWFFSNQTIYFKCNEKEMLFLHKLTKLIKFAELEFFFTFEIQTNVVISLFKDRKLCHASTSSLGNGISFCCNSPKCKSVSFQTKKKYNRESIWCRRAVFFSFNSSFHPNYFVVNAIGYLKMPLIELFRLAWFHKERKRKIGEEMKKKTHSFSFHRAKWKTQFFLSRKRIVFLTYWMGKHTQSECHGHNSLLNEHTM